MTTWTIKSETDDLNRALEFVEDQRSRGYKAWIEDGTGRSLDEQTLKKDDTQRPTRTLYQITLGVLIWGAAAAVVIGALYGCSLLAGD